MVLNCHVFDFTADGLLYAIEEVPPWYLTIFLGLQQYMTMFGSTITMPFLMGKMSKSHAYDCFNKSPCLVTIQLLKFTMPSLLSMVLTSYEQL